MDVCFIFLFDLRICGVVFKSHDFKAWAYLNSGSTLLRDPRYNKGLAFTEKERDAHYLRGLLPLSVITQELQEKRLMHILRQYEVPLHRYMAMMDLQVLTNAHFHSFSASSTHSAISHSVLHLTGEE